MPTCRAPCDFHVRERESHPSTVRTVQAAGTLATPAHLGSSGAEQTVGIGALRGGLRRAPPCVAAHRSTGSSRGSRLEACLGAGGPESVAERGHRRPQRAVHAGGPVPAPRASLHVLRWCVLRRTEGDRATEPRVTVRHSAQAVPVLDRAADTWVSTLGKRKRG